MQGGDQHRSLLADLLWRRAQDFIHQEQSNSETFTT